MLFDTTRATIRPCPIPLLTHRDVPHPERAVVGGELMRIRHGVYALSGLWRALPPWERYLARVYGASLTYPGAVFSHESAAALHGLPIFGYPIIVHVLVPPSGASRSVAGVRTHRSSHDRSIVELGGLAMTSLVDTAVDLARHRHAAIGSAVADGVLRLDQTLTAEDLRTANEGRASDRGRNMARWPLENATPLAETALETISRVVIAWLGFPEPQQQVTHVTSDGVEDRSDFTWEAFGLIGEADGDLKYDGRYGNPLLALRDQRARDARLRSTVPRIAHWGWVEATHVTALRAQLQGLGLPAIAPENMAQLHSLRLAVASRPPHPTGPSLATADRGGERTAGGRGNGN